MGNVGDRQRYFENFVTHVAMAFDKREVNCIVPLCSSDEDHDIFIWSVRTLNEPRKRGSDNLQTTQLNTISYSWEICYYLLLAKQR